MFSGDRVSVWEDERGLETGAAMATELCDSAYRHGTGQPRHGSHDTLYGMCTLPQLHF